MTSGVMYHLQDVADFIISIQFDIVLKCLAVVGQCRYMMGAIIPIVLLAIASVFPPAGRNQAIQGVIAIQRTRQYACITMKNTIVCMVTNLSDVANRIIGV